MQKHECHTTKFRSTPPSTVEPSYWQLVEVKKSTRLLRAPDKESRAAMLRETEILDVFQGNFFKDIKREGSWQGM